MARRALNSYLYVLVVVRAGDRFLLVQERDGSFYLPAGAVEVGESLTTTAIRETKEEAAIDIVPTGLLHFDQHWIGEHQASIKLRFVFTAEPQGDLRPKDFADRHSLGARWVGASELMTLPLRGAEVLTIIDSVASASIMPLQRCYRFFR